MKRLGETFVTLTVIGCLLWALTMIWSIYAS